jgi:hypothetical protein
MAIGRRAGGPRDPVKIQQNTYVQAFGTRLACPRARSHVSNLPLLNTVLGVVMPCQRPGKRKGARGGTISVRHGSGEPFRERLSRRCLAVLVLGVTARADFVQEENVQTSGIDLRLAFC